MSEEYSRRRRNRSSSYHDHSDSDWDDDFDWDEFDRATANDSNNGEVPQYRRRRNGTDGRRRRRQTANAPKQTSIQNDTVYHSDDTNEPRSMSSRKNKGRRRAKKKLTEKQIAFRKRLKLGILFTVLISIVILSGMFVGMYAAVSREIKEMNIQSLALNNNSTIYYVDAQGAEREFEQLQSNSNRIWVNSDSISPIFKDAIVSIEDERFYKHHGVDIKRTVGATFLYAASKVGLGSASYGGSTITQQVIKNITQEDDFKATRKVKEIMRAIALERQLKKDDILTMYCNIAFFANNCDGVEAASQTYFGKSASELNLQEAASIAGITQYPSRFDPIANPENNVEKRNRVLKKMYELGKITESEYNTAVSSKLVLSKDAGKRELEKTSYFADQVVTDVIRDLMKEKNYSEEFASRQVYNGGFKIYATVDPHVQDVMEDVFEDSSNFPSGNGKSQSAMVITDPYTGAVRGLVGGIGEKKDVRGFNRATMAVRQPGSSIKPLSAYAPAIDRGLITEVDVITDEPYTVGSDKWKPKNSYSGFKGDMTIREAVAISSNIPAVKVLEKVGIQDSYGYLQNKFHLSTLVGGDKNYPALSLGGLTKGVKVIDMAAAYGVFVNSGKYITPYTYTKVTDGLDAVILENYRNESQAISESAAYITADLLLGPTNSSRGTAASAKLDSGMPTYGKTGTTDNNFDRWFVGFTPYYVGACWFGFDNPSSITADGVTGNPCVSAWKAVFERLSQAQSHREIAKPQSLIQLNVCSRSGKLPGKSCSTIKAYFVDGTQPKAKCTSHYGLGDGTNHDSDNDKKSSSTPTPKPETATVAPEAEGNNHPSGNGDNSNNNGNNGNTNAGNGSGNSSGNKGNSGTVPNNSGSGVHDTNEVTDPKPPDNPPPQDNQGDTVISGE